jgi:hypothetical protein
MGGTCEKKKGMQNFGWEEATLESGRIDLGEIGCEGVYWMELAEPRVQV